MSTICLMYNVFVVIVQMTHPDEWVSRFEQAWALSMIDIFVILLAFGDKNDGDDLNPPRNRPARA